MNLPGPEKLRELLGWEPPGGVLSVYLRIDHGDRGGGWRIALRDALRAALAAAPPDSDRAAIEATAERILASFGGEGGAPPDGRGQIVLAEINRSEADLRRAATMAPPRAAALAAVGPRPLLQPLVELLDDHRGRGVIAVAGERAKVFEWKAGILSELAEREMVSVGDARDRRAPRNADIPSGQAPTSSGRDQQEQRIDDHRRRFVRGVGEEVSAAAGRHGWDELVCFGEPKALSELLDSIGDELRVHGEEKNLVSIPEHELAERLGELNGELNRERETALIDAAEQSALAGGRGSLGLVETAQALAAGRVEHLIVAADELPPAVPEELRAVADFGAGSPSLPLAEHLIERALLTDAAVTPVEGSAAERLAEREGAAAILRY